ncbi:MAG: hypothetical protein GX199_04665 [Firmicutes bacterium]|nr:hypothetical protein [Bacillota bacterium]
MKKGLLGLLLLLLLWGTAEAAVEVFYLPETGFLRVSGEVVVEPEAASLAFLIFPAAHLTEFWADDLVEYSVQRYPDSTAVVFTVREVRPQQVTFSYEGLVEQRLEQAVLDPHALWLPEFSVPVQEVPVTLQLPIHWEVISEEVQQVRVQGSFQLVELPPTALPPAIVLVNTAPPLAEQPEETAEEVVEDVLEDVVDAVELAEVGGVDLPDEPAVEPRGENEDELPGGRQSETSARIQIQINRFTRALNLRDVEELSELLSPALQEKGLAQYLASLPSYYGTVSSQIVEVPSSPGGTYHVLLSTERGGRYTAAMIWEDGGGALQLTYFRLTPAAPEVPPEIAASCASFLGDLQTALRTGDLTRLETLFAPDLRQKRSDVVDFLLTMDTSTAWALEQITLEPFSITVRVSSGQGDQLLLQFELTPGQYHWLLKGLGVVPLP